ncbi:transcription termination/antitermination protein NusA [Staphylococcus condimenti]|uniref:Transcription termination/antitermination protein NusA n=1 Tax=Staphylococcus condimenti TaxID=70255 RepID=A0A143P8Z7_9STAP|nr:MULTISPECIES: transcription termination factor NusA [Staphylococcus]AMY04936.1 transcription termination/antitermination protein NusA [Staphylococcus condimenti]APR61180.1 transcription termination/antitermination protein NusA [Staphylococcus condimenti]MDK8645033.1 transcription termination factor NusA [Staphylococcus condimenti]OFP01162.1 transcription termination/antitermination protein NusA [Staphylococcus sp. HMSC065E08]PNZ62360.1 transcription termination/antitermination protein NusA 
MSSNELLLATEYLEKEKKIPREVLIDAIEAALITAYKKNYEAARNVRVELNMDEGTFHVIARKEVVDDVFDDREEVDISTALEKNPAYEIGDIYEEDVTPKDFGRVGAQAAKQAVMQRLRDAEREILYDEFIDKEEDIVTGIIDRVDHRYVYVNLGRTEAVLSEAERSPNESYIPNERIKVYVNKVEQTTKGPQIYVSRSHPGLLKRLFEQEVPEIYDGTVVIKSVAREAGDRSKISVYSDNPDIDAVGACVGSKGVRVEAIVEELGGEKIDIVQWNEDPKVFVKNALSPSQVLEVIVDEANQSTTVIVPDYQLSLAIGKRGQNARLAAKLTGWKIDIKSESDAREAGIYPVPEVEETDDEVTEDLTEEVVVGQVDEEPEVDVEAEEVSEIEDFEESEEDAVEELEDEETASEIEEAEDEAAAEEEAIEETFEKDSKKDVEE